MIVDRDKWAGLCQTLLLPEPTGTRTRCRCQDRIFETRQEAIDHLSDYHFRSTRSLASRHILLRKFVTSAQVVLSRRKLRALLLPFENWHSFLHSFHAQLEELNLGVATADKARQKQLQLTVSLVDSFASYVLAHSKVDHLTTIVDRHFRERLDGTQVNLKEFDDALTRANDDLRLCCSTALEHARSAYHQVIVLSQAETRISSIELKSVGLPSIVAGLLATAQSNVLASSQDAATHYEACVARLVSLNDERVYIAAC